MGADKTEQPTVAVMRFSILVSTDNAEQAAIVALDI